MSAPEQFPSFVYLWNGQAKNSHGIISTAPCYFIDVQLNFSTCLACHTHYHLCPFHFVLFKYKVLVTKQRLTYVHVCTLAKRLQCNLSWPHMRCTVHFKGALILLPLTDPNQLLHPGPPRATREEVLLMPLPGHPNLANSRRDFKGIYATWYICLVKYCVHNSTV